MEFNMKNKVYGYCRISTREQSIERQIRNIKDLHENVIIVEEVFTGTKLDGRTKWNNLYKNLKAGDVVVFDSVSRMSRNAKEGFELYEDLFNKGIELEFIKEPQVAFEDNMILNMGQLLSIPFILLGVGFLIYAYIKKQPAEAVHTLKKR